ncbi:BatD family protein [Haloferula chungangensis]|uniref:BatD family protein n=1 Tax=Haloferula chungangensis TaxID=1048331 RepID=A0ABW2L1S7_9BACT
MRFNIPTFFWTALLWLAATLTQAASLRGEIGSRFIIEGEQTLLEYVLSDAPDAGGALVLAPVNGLNISPIGFGAEPRIGLGRRREYVFRYTVSTYQPGDYTIPAATLDLVGETLRSEPIQLRVSRETDIEWSTTKIGNEVLRYAAAFHTIDSEPFLNEVIPTELKIYIPNEQRVEDWGIPEFKRDGVAAWRFEPRPSLGRAKLLGRNYYAVSYPSTLAPTRVGPVQLGPATLRLITVQTTFGQFGAQGVYEAVTLEIPPLDINARALPPGAPEGFEDAIGRFELAVSTDDNEVREGDPINVNILVRGEGNLDTLNVPRPIDEEGWKLYPASPQQRDDRRASTGYTVFRQFMRPLRPHSQVPPFRLVYFDPDQETYATLLSNAIPLTVTPATGPASLGSSAPPALPIPVENMTDILSISSAGSSLLPSGRGLPSWAWQVVPAAIALFLLALIFKSRIAPQLRKDPDELARLRDLKTLEKAPSDLRGFYRAAGHFVERWLGSSDDALPQEILAKRDQSCFKKDVQDEAVPRSERQRILKQLRKLALPLIAIISMFGAGDLHAAESGDSAQDAYESGRYAEAARLWLETGPYERLSADTLYNIGNASYRLGASGEAALYWRRALERDPTHPEARQNLRFFERKFGSIIVKRPDYQHVIASISLDTWKSLVWAGLWIIVLSMLIFPATHRGARWRIAAISGLIIAPIMALAGFCGWYYFPDDARFAPVAEQAVIVTDKATVRTDASRNAPIVIDAPAGSLCQVLTRTGNWTYVAFSNQTRGWVPTGEIELVIPQSPPAVPKLRESTDDGASA